MAGVKHKVKKYVKKYNDNKHSFGWVVSHTKPFMKSLSILMLLSVLTSGSTIAMTLVSRNIIDSATGASASTEGLYTNATLYIVVLLVSLLLTLLSSILTTVIVEKYTFGIRLKIYDSVMKTTWSYISKFHSGDIITRLSSDVQIVATGVAEIIPSIVSFGISFILAFGTLAFFDIRIALFALFLGPVTALIGVVTSRMMRPMQMKIQESESVYKSFMQESVSNLIVYKSFNAQDYASKQMTALRSERIKWVFKRQRISAVSSLLLTLSFQVGYVVTLIYSANQLSLGLITVGTLSTFLTLVAQIQAPLVGLSRVLPKVVSIFTSATRIMEIDNVNLEDSSPRELKSESLGVSCENLSFSYGADTVISNANMTINPGEFVAMMGTSGIGKTTFIRLVMAYLQPSSGSVNLFSDKTGEKQEVNADIRKYISYVPQGNTLISGRIIDNIRLGAPKITEEEIWELLKVVAVDEFVRNTPNGLYTRIGERGIGLSEGQAQRISICRALAKKSPVLILDEATSALDEKTEIAVLEHLRAHTKGLTCILISHRLSIMNYCDRCIRIHEKQIVEDKIS